MADDEDKKMRLERIAAYLKILRGKVAHFDKEIAIQRQKCQDLGHDVQDVHSSARCVVCDEDFGWFCPDNQTHICDYEHEMGWDGDDCIYCHEPEERK